MSFEENVSYLFVRFVSDNIELVAHLLLFGFACLCLYPFFYLFVIKKTKTSENDIDLIESNSLVKVRKALPGLEDGKKALIFANDLVSEEVVVITQDGRQITVNMNDLKQFF